MLMKIYYYWMFFDKIENLQMRTCKKFHYWEKFFFREKLVNLKYFSLHRDFRNLNIDFFND